MKEKKDIERKIAEFFEEIEQKSSEEVKKIKKIAMSCNIRLGELRKNFCKNCYTPLIPGLTCKIKIKNKKRIVKCKVCGFLNRQEIKNKI
ncbi:MAG: hypothetical protein QW625_02725 [Candidatus Nanoarchaeia archaeon]